MSGAPPPWTRRASPRTCCGQPEHRRGPVPAGGAEALAAGQPRPDRRPSCFFDPRHGMSVADVAWTPPDGGPAREVPVCADACTRSSRASSRRCAPCAGRVADAGQLRQRRFAPAYWGGYGYGPGLFTGFLLGSGAVRRLGRRLRLRRSGLGRPRLGRWPGLRGRKRRELRRRRLRRRRQLRRRGGDFGGGDNFSGGDFGGGDFGGGDFGGGDFGGGDNFGN